MKNQTLFAGLLASTALLAAGCVSTRAAKKTDASAAARPAAPAAAPAAARAADGEPDVREMATREAPELKVVHFPYDSDRLDEAARGILRANADYLRTRAELKIQVAGNCDQRGTVAYNLALGQRRAAAVRSYYQALGIEPSRVATLSYGKEKTICAEESDSCWERNRRAATLEMLSLTVAGWPAL